MPAAVITRVSLRDDMSSKIDAMSAKFDTFASRTEKAFARASRGGVRFKSILGGILASELVMRGLAYLQYGIRGVTEEVINFDHYLTVAAAQFDGLADKGTAGFARLEKSIRDISKRTQFTPTEVAQAYENFAKAGFDLNDALAATPALLDLATAADMNLEQTVEVASDTLFAFGLTVKDIQDPLRRAAALTSNLTRVSDVLAKASIESTTDIEGMYEVLKQSGPVAKLAGVDIETWAAFATVMAQQSIKGSIAGTALKNIFQRMARPTKAAAKALKEIGLIPTDKNGKLRDFVDIFGELHDKLAKLPDSKKVGVLYDLFGRHAVAGSAAAMSAAKALKEYQTMLRTSAKGTSGTMAEKIRGSLKNQLLMLRNQIYGIGIAIDEAFAKKFPEAFTKFKKWLTSINPEKVAEKIVYFTDKLVALFNFIHNNWRWLLVLAAGYETLTIAMSVMSGTGFLGGIVSRFMSASAAGMGFRSALLSILGVGGPVVLLLAALAGAIALLATRWKEVKDFWTPQGGAKGVGSIENKPFVKQKPLSKQDPFKVFGSMLGFTTDFAIDALTKSGDEVSAGFEKIREDKIKAEKAWAKIWPQSVPTQVEIEDLFNPYHINPKSFLQTPWERLTPGTGEIPGPINPYLPSLPANVTRWTRPEDTGAKKSGFELMMEQIAKSSSETMEKAIVNGFSKAKLKIDVEKGSVTDEGESGGFGFDLGGNPF